MKRKLFLVALSIILLSGGWLGATGLTLLVALVPLMMISDMAEDSRKGWWSTCGWAALTFVGWNLATIWWIGYATPFGPIAATLFSAFYSLLGFMIYHTVSKRAPRALAYVVLVSVWIALEKFYMEGDLSWPWLLLGNGLSNDIWAVQWYEYTGIYGGALWILICNIFVFEVQRSVEPRQRRLRIIRSAVVVFAPIICSLVLFWSYKDSGDEALEISIIQPNVDFYNKGEDQVLEDNILSLMAKVPTTADIVVLPETVLPRSYWEASFINSPFANRLRDTMSAYSLEAEVVLGLNTLISYDDKVERPYTARKIPNTKRRYYDVFNSAAVVPPMRVDSTQVRHKSKLVIGVENVPSWLLDLFAFLSVDMGNIQIGQLGVGGAGEAFDIAGERVGVAICYEGLFGEFFSGFINDGAEVMTVISNDCWWHESPGFRHLYTITSLRAVEYRRSIARSANTGRSGYIDARGVSMESMAWGERGVMTHSVPLNDKVTVYAKFGDFVARIAQLVAMLSLLYYISYRVRKRHYLVD